MYEVPARILLQLNKGPNPATLSEFSVRAKNGGRNVDDNGVVSHLIGEVDLSYGLVLALVERIRNGDEHERNYIRTQLHEMIGELDK